MKSPAAMPMTAEEEAEALAMLKAGKTTGEIVDWIGCSEGQVRRIKLEGGFRDRDMHPARNARVIADRKDGLTWGQIAVKHGLTRDQVAGILRRHEASRPSA